MSRRVAADKRKGGEFESYATPGWCVDRLLDWMQLRYKSDQEDPLTMIEPACGDGAIIEAVNRRMKVDLWHAIDIEKEPRMPVSDSLVYTKGDFLNMAKCQYDNMRKSTSVLLITNPPFSKAEAFVRKAVDENLATQYAFLLRLNFLESSKRREFFDEYPPSHVLVLPNRPSFTDDRKTDGTAYAWFIWNLWTKMRIGNRNQPIPLEILGTTSKEERKKVTNAK